MGGGNNGGNNPGNPNAPGYNGGIPKSGIGKSPMGGVNNGGNNPGNPNASGYNGGSSNKGSSSSGSYGGGGDADSGSHGGGMGGNYGGSSSGKSSPGPTNSFGGPKPILLDLNGDGVKITELSRSTVFMDSAGDGLQHRTAWAGVGDGVLFFDVNNDGKIGEQREYVFTEWDPTATTDMEVLRSAFDSNGDGKLTAADSAFGQFKVMVTAADCSLSAKTLTELGITEINLKADATNIVLPDGSVISGQALFKRADGTTGIAADTTLVAEADGNRVVQTMSADAAGTRTVVSKSYDANGNLAFSITSVTSKDGHASVNSYDDDGDGVTDRIQTIDTVINADGSQTETEINREGGSIATAAVFSRTVTMISVDKHTITIQRDSTGGGWFDQREVRVENADGTRTNTISDLARDGTVLSKSVETVSADGSTRLETIDLDNDGLIDSKVSDVFVQQGTERVNTVTISNRDGSLRTASEERVSADGRTKLISTDLNGDGIFEARKSLAIAVAAGGETASVLKVLNADGTLRSQTEQAQSADALTKTIRADVDGDGDFDSVTVDATVIAADGGRTETITIRNLNGSIYDMVKSVLGADKVTAEGWEDLNQDGVFQSTDLVSSVTVNAATQERTATEWARNADGSVNTTSTSVTSADGLSITTRQDMDGDGDVDTATRDITVRNADGTSTRTITVSNGDGSQRSQAVVTTSADGLTQTTVSDLAGNNDADQRSVEQLVKNADGSLTRTVTILSGNGAGLLAKTVTTESADRLTSTVSIDLNGDGARDLSVTSSEAANGAVTVTTEAFRPNGQLASRAVSWADGTGLLHSSTLDANGDGVIETSINDITTLNADGSRTRTVDTNNGDGSDRGWAITWERDDGLETTTRSDLNGDNAADRSTRDLTSFGNDGSVTRVT